MTADTGGFIFEPSCTACKHSCEAATNYGTSHVWLARLSGTKRQGQMYLCTCGRMLGEAVCSCMSRAQWSERVYTCLTRSAECKVLEMVCRR